MFGVNYRFKCPTYTFDKMKEEIGQMDWPFGSKKMHNPPFGYFSAVYMTLSGILTIAIKTFEIDIHGQIDWRWTEFLVAIMFAVTLWHK